MSKHEFPRDKGLDHTLEVLLKEGYAYILDTKKELNSNVFETRLLGEKAICLSGVEAAELFYDNEKFTRKDAMPNRVLDTLFGQDGVQTLNDEAHDHRKELFMPLLSKEVIQDFHRIAKNQWTLATNKWTGMDEVTLYEDAQEILTRIACEWLGVPVKEDDYRDLADDLTNMFEAAAKVGPAHHAGKKSRKKREQWLTDFVKDVRNDKVELPQEKAIHQFIWHKDLHDQLLEPEVVAVEILNILRPMVAVAVYINFVALALHDFPEQKEQILENDQQYTRYFAQEVRRFYPFFPFAGARVKKDFEWNGYTFEKQTLTLLDLYGTNHDETIWDNPESFNPKRFQNREENAYDFIPQGGGDYLTGHRCPGELVTIEMMKMALHFFVNHIDYDLPQQDFSYSMTEMPSVPKDHIILTNVQKKS